MAFLLQDGVYGSYLHPSHDRTGQLVSLCSTAFLLLRQICSPLPHASSLPSCPSKISTSLTQPLHTAPSHLQTVFLLQQIAANQPPTSGNPAHLQCLTPLINVLSIAMFTSSSHSPFTFKNHIPMQLVRQLTSLTSPIAPTETHTLTPPASRALRPARLCMLAFSSSWPPSFTMQSLRDPVVHLSSPLATVEVSYFLGYKRPR